MEVAFLIASLNNLFSKLNSAFSALCEYLAECEISALSKANFLNCLKLSIAIATEAVDSNDYRNAILLKVINMSLEVNCATLKSLYIFSTEVSLCNTTVLHKSTNGCNENYRRWLKVSKATLDIKELLCAKVSTKSCLCDCVICELKRKLCCSY